MHCIVIGINISDTVVTPQTARFHDGLFEGNLKKDMKISFGEQRRVNPVYMLLERRVLPFSVLVEFYNMM